MELTQNPSVLELVRKTAELTTPKEIVWIDGSEAQLESLRKIAVETGELIKLNEEKLPGCYLNRSDVNDVARVEGRTFICSRTREEAGPTNNWMDPNEMKAKLHEILRCAMAGRTMYVIPYSMGVIGSPFAKYGIEVTDSIYVVLNMAIMTRIGTKVLDALGDSSDVILGVHSKVTLDPENRYIVHFPEENKIISVNSNYGGNVLQGKKCFSLRIAGIGVLNGVVNDVDEHLPDTVFIPVDKGQHFRFLIDDADILPLCLFGIDEHRVPQFRQRCWRSSP